MAAANFSRDVLEMFYGPIDKNQRLRPPISPNIRGEFEIVRNNFNDWLRVWKMRAPDVCDPSIVPFLRNFFREHALVFNYSRNFIKRKVVVSI